MRPPLDGDNRVQTVARPLAAPVREPRGDGERPGDGLAIKQEQGQPRAAAGEGAARRQRVGRRGEALGDGRALERRDRHVVPELARRDSDGEARGRRRVDDERAGRCRVSF